MSRQVAYAFVLYIVVAAPGLYACVSYQGYGIGTASIIGVQVGSGWTTAPPIASAVAMWNSTCGSSGGVPSLVEGYGDIDIVINFNDSRMTVPGGGCAYFDPLLGSNGEVIGGNIEVFRNDWYGSTCDGMLAHIYLDNVIAHELGHALGLANSGCSNYLMGPDYIYASVNSAECTAADSRWTTAAEQEQPPDEDEPPAEGPDPTCNQPSFCSPLLLDLNGDGIHTTGADATVHFDINGDGMVERLGWTNPATEEGFLWVDHIHNGLVNDGRELFGNGTRLPSGHRAADGFEALAVYDDVQHGGNGDGQVTNADWMWGRLRIWVDRNHDGVSQRVEVAPIHESGVVALHLATVPNTVPDASGNLHGLLGTYVMRVRGQLDTRSLVDVFFRVYPPLGQ